MMSILPTTLVIGQGSSLGYGLKGGVNIPTFIYTGENFTYTTSYTTNFFLTAYVDIPLKEQLLSLQTGLSLQSKGGRMEEYAGGRNMSHTEKILWLEVPATFLTRIPAGASHFFLGTGPYVAYGLSGKNTYHKGWLFPETEFSFEHFKKRVDFGANFIVGFQTGSGFIVQGGYALGLKDLTPKSPVPIPTKVFNRGWSVGIGLAY